jgi:BRCA2, oligonucleotide/oligosaccharide-binding, domain 1/BRCA2, helical
MKHLNLKVFIFLPLEPPNRTPLKECSLSPSYICNDDWNKMTIAQTPDFKFGKGGYEAVHSILLDKGCIENCISLEWTRNHYKWILYKLICKSRRIESTTITFDDVVRECLYRYKREVDDCKRSAIKKILEGDGIATAHMVLFVSFLKRGAERWEMKICDGWYEVGCQVDACMTRLIDSGKIFVGIKLHIQGASLMGEATAVLDSKAILKFSGNNCRPGKWWGTLGVCKPGIFSIRLDSIISDGGVVGCIDFVVNRIFPVMYSEKVDGAPQILRNSREDGEVAREWDLAHDRMFATAEKLYHSGELKFETRDIRKELCDYTDEQHPPRKVSIVYTCQVIDLSRGSRSILSIYTQNDSDYDHWKEGMIIQMFGITGSANHIRSTYKSSHQILKGQSDWYTPRKLVGLDYLETGDIADLVIVAIQTVQISSKPLVLKILATDESLHPVLLDYMTNTPIIPGSVLMCNSVNTSQGSEDGFRLICEKYSIVSIDKPIKPYLKSDRIKELKSWFSKR